MKAKLQILYHERLEGKIDLRGHLADIVEVTLRKWSYDSPNDSYRDAVMETRVWKSGKLLIDDIKILKSTFPNPNSQLIRIAIVQFDKMVKLNPNVLRDPIDDLIDDEFSDRTNDGG